MIEQDTIKLLRECDAGIKMGVSAIDEVLEYVKYERLGKYLSDSRDEHVRLDGKLQELLDKYRDGRQIVVFKSRTEADEYIANMPRAMEVAK